MSPATSYRSTTLSTPTPTTIELTRTFEAPLDLVWQLWNDPVRIPDFWGPRMHVSRVDRFDFHEGGRWRIVSRDLEGNEYAFRGEFKQIEEFKLVRWTFEYEGMPDEVSEEALYFEGHDGTTTIRSVATFSSPEERDAMLDSGMEDGATEMHDRFAELLEREHG